MISSVTLGGVLRKLEVGEVTVSLNGQENVSNSSFSSKYLYFLLDAYSRIFSGYIQKILKK